MGETRKTSDDDDDVDDDMKEKQQGKSDNEATDDLIADIVDQLESNSPKNDDEKKKLAEKSSDGEESALSVPTLERKNERGTSMLGTTSSSSSTGAPAPVAAPGAVRVTTSGRVRVDQDTTAVEDSSPFEVEGGEDVETGGVPAADRDGGASAVGASATVASSSDAATIGGSSSVGATTTTASVTTNANANTNNDAGSTTATGSAAEVVSAAVVNEEELEAEFQARMKAKMVEATEVRPHEEMEHGGVDGDKKVMDGSTPDNNKSKWIVGGVLVIAAIVAIVLGVTLSGKNGSSTDTPPTPAPTFTTESYLTELFLSTSGKPLLTNGSPQNKALNWMVNDDTYTANHLSRTNTTSGDDWVLKERYAMATLYYATNGEYWSDQLRFLSNISICEWPNLGENETDAVTDNEVDCKDDPKNKRVVKLRIETNNLTGTVPLELSLLSEIEILTLGGNSDLGGTLPPELGNLLFLDFLQFSGCSLNGTIPEEYSKLTNLVTFAMFRNQLSGTIGTSIIGGFNLERLDLGLNQLTGPIPDIFNTQSPLARVYLDENQLTGTFPSSLYAQPRLEQLFLSNNRFTGTIGPQISALESLVNLWLDGNDFTGPIPTQIGDLPDVDWVLLSSNNFYGTIPSTLAGLTKMSRLDLSNNLLTGPLPSELGNAQSLQSLDISHNVNISGTVPLSFSEMSMLTSFALTNTSIIDGLEQAFCTQPLLLTEIEADCGGGDTASIQCSCCTTCCDPTTGDCDVSVAAVCRTKASVFESVDGRGAVCSCAESDDGTAGILSCSDTSCESCNIGTANCASNTDYGYVLNGTTAEIMLFANTIPYLPGSEWEGTELRYENADYHGDGNCAVFVNGTKCRSCANINCASGFNGFRIFCDNLDNGGYNFNSCDENLNNGYLDIFLTYDEALADGCPLLLERV